MSTGLAENIRKKGHSMASGYLECIKLSCGFSPFNGILVPIQYKYKYHTIQYKSKYNVQIHKKVKSISWHDQPVYQQMFGSIKGSFKIFIFVVGKHMIRRKSLNWSKNNLYLSHYFFIEKINSMATSYQSIKIIV